VVCRRCIARVVEHLHGADIFEERAPASNLGEDVVAHDNVPTLSMRVALEHDSLGRVAAPVPIDDEVTNCSIRSVVVERLKAIDVRADGSASIDPMQPVVGQSVSGPEDANIVGPITPTSVRPKSGHFVPGDDLSLSSDRDAEARLIDSAVRQRISATREPNSDAIEAKGRHVR
jgi:hypothetical protein